MRFHLRPAGTALLAAAAVAIAAGCAGPRDAAPTQETAPAVTATVPPQRSPTPSAQSVPTPPGTAVIQTPPVDRPNFVVIITDDQRLSTMAYMPLTNRLLGDRGATFDNYFVTDPLCCPSRATILRGQYPHNHQVLSNGGATGGFKRFRRLGHESSTIASWLQEAGYRTALMGKYLNGYPSGDLTYVPPGWTEWYGTTDPLYYGFTLNENGVPVTYGSAPADYETDVISRKAVDFINRAAADGPPFFLYLAPFAPHSPSTPANRHLDFAPGIKAPRTDAFDEEDTSDKPAFIQEMPRLGEEEVLEADRSYGLQVRSLQAVDELVDAVVATLASAGLAEETYVIFTSDNGYHTGEHRLPAGKGSPYDHDVRVPLLVAGPGIAPGRHVAAIALNNDLAPTLAQLAGSRSPAFMDGRSLWPLLGAADSGAVPWRAGFAIEFWSDEDGQRPVPPYAALRTAGWLYVEWEAGDRELYDLAADPEQLENVYGRASAETAEALKKSLEKITECSSAECVVAEDTAAP